MRFTGLVTDGGVFKAEPERVGGEPWKVWQEGLDHPVALSAPQLIAVHHEAGHRAWGHFGTDIVPLLDEHGVPLRDALALIVPLLGDAERRLLQLFGVDLEQYEKT